MTKIEKVLLTGKTHTTFSGRGGRVDLNLSAGKGAGANITFPAVEAPPDRGAVVRRRLVGLLHLGDPASWLRRRK